MIKLIPIIFCLCPLFTIGQKQANKKEFCSSVIKDLSYFWKNDSLGNNGFRYYAYKRILNSKLDTLSVDSLIMYLGKPNNIIESTTTQTYIYNFFDMNKMQGDYKGRYVYYIGFDKKNKDTHFFRVYEWSSE